MHYVVFMYWALQARTTIVTALAVIVAPTSYGLFIIIDRNSQKGEIVALCPFVFDGCDGHLAC